MLPFRPSIMCSFLESNLDFLFRFETINVDTKNKPDWFLEKNPLGLVPVLEQDDKIVYESAICNDYLDDVYPEEKLTPSDPYRNARDKILCEMHAKVRT